MAYVIPAMHFCYVCAKQHDSAAAAKSCEQAHRDEEAKK